MRLKEAGRPRLSKHAFLCRLVKILSRLPSIRKLSRCVRPLRRKAESRFRVFCGRRVRRSCLVVILLPGSFGPTENSAESGRAKTTGFEIGVAYWALGPEAESCLRGLREGLAESGFIEGRNVELHLAHAQGEMMNIPSMLQDYDGRELDAIVTMTTPLLTAACNTVKNTSVVFTCVF